nr:hypothetical protein [Tanacetum cinerariifolium]
MVRKEASHQIILGVTNETHGIATGLIAEEKDGMDLSTKGFRRFDGQKKPTTRDDKSHLKCEEYGMNRHTKDQCFKIIVENPWPIGVFKMGLGHVSRHGIGGRGSRWFIFLGTLVTRCFMAIGPPIWITDDFEALVFGMSIHAIFFTFESQWLKNVSYHKLYDILKQHQHEVNEIRAEKIARVANPLALVAQQQPVYHPQTHPTHYNQNSSTRSPQAATRNRGKAIVNSPQPIYDQEPSMVDNDDDEMSKDKEIDKLVALISPSFKKIYKPTNNNLRTSSNTSRANQDNSLRINRNAGYESQRSGNVAGARETVDAVDSGPIFDKEPEQK